MLTKPCLGAEIGIQLGPEVTGVAVPELVCDIAPEVGDGMSPDGLRRYSLKKLLQFAFDGTK